MTPAEFRNIRLSLGLTADQLARFMGFNGGRAVRKWESGSQPVNPVAARIMGWLDKGYLSAVDD